MVSFFRFITTPFRWVFNKIADIYHRFRPISDTTIYPYTLASSEIQKKFASFVTPEFAKTITSTSLKNKDKIKLSDEQKQLIREYPFTFVSHVNKMSVIPTYIMPNFFERKKQKSKNEVASNKLFFRKRDQHQEYPKQMIAYMLGQSSDRTKEGRTVAKAYLETENNTMFNNRAVYVQNANAGFKSLSYFMSDPDNIANLRQILYKEYAISGDNDPKAKLINEMIDSIRDKGVGFADTDLIEILFNNAAVSNNYSLFSLVKKNIIQYKKEHIFNSFKTGKISFEYEGKKVEADIDYKSLAKSALLIWIMSDWDGLSQYLTNVGAHYDASTNKLYFHKIDFGCSYLEDERIGVTGSVPHLECSDNKLSFNGERWNQIFSYIPHEFIVDAAKDMLSASDKSRDAYFAKLEKVVDKQDIEFLSKAKVAIYKRLGKLEELVKPFVPNLDAIKSDAPLLFPQNPQKIYNKDAENFKDMQQSTGLGNSGGGKFRKVSKKQQSAKHK